MDHPMKPSLLAVLLLSSATAAAQGTITASIVEISGAGTSRTTAEDILDGMNIADCEDGAASITIELGSNPGQVDLWHNNGGSLDCSLEENRLSDADMRNCVHLDPNPTVTADRRLTINLADVIAGDAESGDGTDVCERNRTDIGFYLLDTDAEIEHGPSSSFAFITVSIDGEAPSPPVLESGDLTGNQIPVNWDAVSDGQDGPNQLRYEVQVETAGCGLFGTTDAGADDAGMTDDAGMDDAGMTDAGAIDASAADGGVTDAGIADAAVDGTMSFAVLVPITTDLGETAVTIDLEALNVSEGATAGLRVATQDQAGNVGAFSNEICLTRITGSGPCDFIEGGCTDSSGCSAGGGDPTAALAFLMLAVAWGRRR